MKSSSSGRGAIILGIMVATMLVSELLSSRATAAEPETPAVKDGGAPAVVVQPTAAQRDAWRASMAKVPLPKKGCFTATYPDTAWREVPCTTAPNRPYPPNSGGLPYVVGGGGTDYSAQVSSGFISSAVGSFDSVTGVTSESQASTPNAYSLQLNTNNFTTTACSGAKNPSACAGWEQFIFSNAPPPSSTSAFIQYWLLGYFTKCPTGWNGWGNDCWINSTQAASAPDQTIATLGDITLTGAAASGSTPDSVTLAIGNTVYSAQGDNHFPDLAKGWQAAEFNVFGDGGGSQAVFNAGSTIVVRTSVNNGSLSAPSCALEGFTAESNNLTLVGTPSIVSSGTLPSIVFTESNPPGTPEACATSVGDTHLTTFDSLLYDFQASGDFVLVQADPDFVVQSRQALAVDPQATGWKQNVMINKAVATQMGETRVAVCLNPTRLMINGMLTNLDDGKSLSLAGGVSVLLSGNVYVITRPGGDIVHAVLNNNNINTWIDVTVGLPRSPQAKIRGLLASANGNASAIATSNGTMLPAPVSFTDLYHTYAESWVVAPAQSLLCETPKVEFAVPAQPFYAGDIEPALYQTMRATCTAAGITDAALLDACTLDTAVLGDATAAKVFTHAVPPRAVMARPVMPSGTITK
jgi:VWD domain-containing protein